MNFEEASRNVKLLDEKPCDQDLLELYGLYKQSTVGDVNTERPSFWDLVGKSKWDSWKSYEGLSIDEAKDKYIELANKLMRL
jgi:diazepam-binding inhibitor (GABA receptor modulator, acyl-CoA-binding protein)